MSSSSSRRQRRANKTTTIPTSTVQKTRYLHPSWGGAFFAVLTEGVGTWEGPGSGMLEHLLPEEIEQQNGGFCWVGRAVDVDLHRRIATELYAIEDRMQVFFIAGRYWRMELESIHYTDTDSTQIYIGIRGRHLPELDSVMPPEFYGATGARTVYLRRRDLSREA